MTTPAPGWSAWRCCLAGLLSAAVILPALRAADSAPAPTNEKPAVPAQKAPRPEVKVGTLDFFGLRTVTEADVRAKLGFKEGDVYRREQEKAVTKELETLPGVARATLAAITTDGSGLIHIFVGLQEKDAKGFELSAAPTGEIVLPPTLLQIYEEAMQALGPAVRSGKNSQSTKEGHALDTDPAMRAKQDAAVLAMKTDLAIARRVLRESADARHRTAAAWFVGYAPDKAAIIPDLTAAARDPDPGPRNNATRALGVIADYAKANPKLGLRIDPGVFIDMLGSVTWTDRNKSTFVLSGLAKGNHPEMLRELRARAMPELIEMARWKSHGHETSSLIILGRMAGWEESKIMRAWHAGQGEEVIAAAVGKK